MINLSLLYVALGDSLSTGVGASMFSPGFVQRYRRISERELQRQIQLSVFARSGNDTSDLVQLLKEASVRSAIKSAQIITITAGGNDLIHAYEKYKSNQNEEMMIDVFKKYKKNISKIICSVHGLMGDVHHQYIIRISNLYNPLPDDKLANKWVKRFNQYLNTFHNECNIQIVDLFTLFKENREELLTYDHIHPNDRGHQRIAETFYQSGYGQIDKKKQIIPDN